MKKINWNRLKENRCPKCGKDIEFNTGSSIFKCGGKCGFAISDTKLKQLVSKMVDDDLFYREHGFRRV